MSLAARGKTFGQKRPPGQRLYCAYASVLSTRDGEASSAEPSVPSTSAAIAPVGSPAAAATVRYRSTSSKKEEVCLPALCGSHGARMRSGTCTASSKLVCLLPRRGARTREQHVTRRVLVPVCEPATGCTPTRRARPTASLTGHMGVWGCRCYPASLSLRRGPPDHGRPSAARASAPRGRAPRARPAPGPRQRQRVMIGLAWGERGRGAQQRVERTRPISQSVCVTAE